MHQDSRPSEACQSNDCIRLRVRELLEWKGLLRPGPRNALTDVPGVRVGHTTLVSGEGPLRPGRGPIRTGVTVVLPHCGSLVQEKVRAAVHAINGHGKVLGFEEVREVGVIESPIALTNTFNVGLVADALLVYAMRNDVGIGVLDRSRSVNVVVGETNDSYLNDLRGRHVREGDVLAAIEAAIASPQCSAVEEGAVGAGTGTSCFGWKGGIGTASRILPDEVGGFCIGALVQSNFGVPEQLTILGVPVGERILPPNYRKGSEEEAGSIMITLATDAPLTSRQLWRICLRAVGGVVRTGSMLGPRSGEFVIAFSTTNRIPHEPSATAVNRTVIEDEDLIMGWLFPAVIESVEEAVLNSLFVARTVVGRDGNVRYALPIDDVTEIVEKSGKGEGGRPNAATH